MPFKRICTVLGLLISVCPAIDYSWLYTKRFERFKFLCLLENPSYDQVVKISEDLRPDMSWWLEHVKEDCSILRFNNFSLEIFSDASLTGWGAYYRDHEASGYWREEEWELHINFLELKAALFALKSFTDDLRDTEILMRIDNTTAIACINRMGSVQYPHFEVVTREIWQWCERRRLFVFASYINTKDNFEADQLSRQKFKDTEWELADYAFREIVDSLGQPEVDLFASRNNAKCSRFVSWKNEPGAWNIDSFTIPWSDLNFYAFPPFSIILKMLQKILHEKAEGIVVVPEWPTQPWYPLLQKMIVSVFKPNRYLLQSPFRQAHNLHASLTLVAVRLSGKR